MRPGSLLLAVLLLCGTSSHSNTRSLGRIVEKGRGFELSLTVDADRMLQSVGHDLPDGTLWTEAHVEDAADRIFEYVASRYELTVEGRPWRLRPDRVEPTVSRDPVLDLERMLELTVWFYLDAPEDDAPVTVRHQLFAETETFHEHIFRVEMNGRAAGWPTIPGQTLVVPFEDPSSRGERRRALRFAAQGVGAAWRTPLAFCFVLALLLGLVSRREQSTALLGFFAGAATTLPLVALAVLTPSHQWARVAMLVSVTYVALENIWAADQKLRWASALLFGLVHGLAFGHALLEFGLPVWSGRSTSLVAFVVGVASGLCLGLVPVWPWSVWLARKSRSVKALRYAVNGGLVVTGLALFVVT